MNKVGELVQGGKSVGEKHARVLNHVGLARVRSSSSLENGKSKSSSAGRALDA